MDPGQKKKELTLQGDPSTPEFKEAAAVLDRSGLTYRVRRPPPGIGAELTRVCLGREVLTGFTRQQLVAFLWSLGAKFEDS